MFPFIPFKKVLIPRWQMSQVFCFVKTLLISVHQFLDLKYYDIILQLFTIIQYFIGPVGQLKCAAPCWPWICSTLVQGVSSSSWTEFALSIIRWVLRSHVRPHVMGSVSWRGSLKMILNCNEAWRNMTGNVQPEGLPIEKDPRWAYCAPCSMKNEPSVGLPGQSDITHRDFWSIACLALVECVMYMGSDARSIVRSNDALPIWDWVWIK